MVRMAGRKKKPRSAPVPAGADGVKRASLFMNGRSQAVRLPKEFRFEGTHVFARKEGDRVILSPVDDRWERFLAAFGSAPEFPERDQPSLQKRDEIDAWVDASD
jgi:antitoxin VapB